VGGCQSLQAMVLDGGIRGQARRIVTTNCFTLPTELPGVCARTGKSVNCGYKYNVQACHASYQPLIITGYEFHMTDSSRRLHYMYFLLMPRLLDANCNIGSILQAWKLYLISLFPGNCYSFSIPCS
jgi:hypothetical protein